MLCATRLIPGLEDWIKTSGIKEFKIPIDQSEVLSPHKDTEILISSLEDNLDSEALVKIPNLKIISQFAVGVNNIDLEYCRENNIAVGHTPGVLTEATANTALTLLMMLARQAVPATQNAKSGYWRGWEPMGFIGKSLKGKTLGIIGMGRIGAELSRMLKQLFSMNILYYGPSKKPELEKELDANFVELNSLLRESDVVSIHCPLLDTNHKFLNEEKLSLMKQDSILINTARGALIDQDALVEYLNQKKFFGVGLDVTDPEPLSKEHPLYQFDRVVIFPHIGSAENETRDQMASLVFINIENFMKGNPLKASAI